MSYYLAKQSDNVHIKITPALNPSVKVGWGSCILRPFDTSFADFTKAVHEIGFPCVVKPLMSSSGKGQSVLMQVLLDIKRSLISPIIISQS